MGIEYHQLWIIVWYSLKAPNLLRFTVLASNGGGYDMTSDCIIPLHNRCLMRQVAKKVLI